MAPSPASQGFHGTVPCGILERSYPFVKDSKGPYRVLAELNGPFPLLKDLKGPYSCVTDLKDATPF